MASSFSEFIVTSKVSLVILIKLSFVCQSLLNTWHQETELQCWLLYFSFTFLLLFFIPSTLIAEKVTKICDPNGNWFRHPESNRTWTNYTQCNIYTHEKVKVGKEWVHDTSVKKLNWKSLRVSKLKRQQSRCNNALSSFLYTKSRLCPHTYLCGSMYKCCFYRLQFILNMPIHWKI